MKARAVLGSVEVGGGAPVRVMAAVNASPESFYKGSVAVGSAEVSRRVAEALEGGAELIDVGGASTAPYLETGVPEKVERERAVEAVRAAVEAAGGRGAVSVDTVRASVADAALRAGAAVVNDVSGLKNDPAMARTVRDRGASLLAMAHSTKRSRLGPLALVGRALEETLKIADRAGIEERLIVVDPGIGFFRSEGPGATTSVQDIMPWYEWDCEVLANLSKLRALGRPVGVGVSRKSFIGKILGLSDPEERLAGSLAATAVAVMNGADLVRTHDARETVQAVRVAESVKARRAP